MFFANPLPSLAQVLLGHLPEAAACPAGVPLNCANAGAPGLTTNSNVAIDISVRIFNICPSRRSRQGNQSKDGVSTLDLGTSHPDSTLGAPGASVAQCWRAAAFQAEYEGSIPFTRSKPSRRDSHFLSSRSCACRTATRGPQDNQYPRRSRRNRGPAGACAPAKYGLVMHWAARPDADWAHWASEL